MRKKIFKIIALVLAISFAFGVIGELLLADDPSIRSVVSYTACSILFLVYSRKIKQ